MSAQKHLYGGVRFVEEIPKSTSGKILRRKFQHSESLGKNLKTQQIFNQKN